MTRDRRLLVLLILLMAYGLFAVEGRHRPREDAETDARHRHRHRHESSNGSGRRTRHDLADRRCASSWSQELEFEDDSPADREDREDREDEEEEEDDYEDARFYYERSYPSRSSRNAVHGRAFEPRYPPRSHRGGYRTPGWYDQDDHRRRASPRHAARSYPKLRSDRTHRRLVYSRNRDSDYVSEEDEFDYGKPRVYDAGDSLDRYASWWKSNRKHRPGASGSDWRSDSRRRHRLDDSEPTRRVDDSRRRPVYNASWSLYSKTDRRRIDSSEDNEYRVDDEDDVEEDAWKETEDEDPSEEEDDDEELDNDFYNAEKKAPLTTYDDIIRRLTSDDSTTAKPTVKRDYRNSETDRHIKRDALGTLKHEPRNLSRPLPRDRGKISAYVYAASEHRSPSKIGESLPGKLLGSVLERKSAKNASNLVTKSGDRPEKKAASKIDDTQPKTKSLEQDYEYLNTSDNEKEEDLARAGVEEDVGMQADVTNTDYTGDEDEAETPATASPSTTTTTTTTSTTTARPVVTQNYDYRDPRGYEGSTGAQYNGYQSKNDYPPMSAHSDHKWRHLGTRDSVKETRSNMQQYNKSGKTSEIQEALQHAKNVFRDGVCKWPQPRVIPVRDVYPSPSTTYIPHCAILHRCSDDTGCCRSEALTCVPKYSHRVELSFYTIVVGGGSLVEKLSFYNHTECECRERTEHDASNEKPSEQRVYRHHQSSPQHPNARWSQPRKPCRCPSEFTPRITSEGVCQCNCFETHQNCIKIRRGKGYFSLADRLCIQNEECAMPSCEFGEYMRRQGKCPKKKDKFDAIANYHTNLNYLRHRS